MFRVLLVVSLRVLLAAASSSDPFEWAGIFETPEDKYMWTAQKVNNGTVTKYADASMKLVALPASDATDAVLHALETDGGTALGLTCTVLQPGGVITPATSTCYQLSFDNELWQSLYTIDATGVAHVAFFTEHVPTEFENTAHYLKDDHGDDIEPVAELPEASPTPAAAAAESDTPWGAAIGASVIVNFTTLVGVIFLVPAIMKLAGEHVVQFEGLVSGFAAGAISACAFFFLLFESTHLVAVGWTEEVEVIWRWGSMILAGFLLPAIIQVSVDAGVDVALKNKGEAEKPAAEEGEAPTLSIRARLVGGILIGDFFHNLCDGFFIGAAFKGCGNSFGWTVAASTIFHEIAQELSDYFILTGPLAKIRPPVALGLNFVSGLSVLLGAIIVCSEDIPDEQTGLLLAFGGGTYLHIAFTESMPRIYNPLLSVRARAASLGMFLVGAIAIGLVLLEHEHCVPSVAGAPAPAGGGHHH